MNREITFRGKELIHNKWIYGGLAEDKYENAVILPKNNWQKGGCVNKDTIGQFTGLYDKNGREIYEGDILLFRIDIFTSKPIAVVFHNGAFGYFYTGDFVSFVGNTNFKFCINGSDESFQIIGNIHDNPELIKEEQL